MALNYSHHVAFPPHVSEDNLVPPVRIVNGYLMEGVPARKGDACLKPWHLSQGEAEEQNFNCWRDRVDHLESTSKDIVDLLPSDPFGMDIQSTFTAITGWLEDLEVDYGGYMRSNNATNSQEGYGLFAGWNLIWNNSFNFQLFPGPFHLEDKSNMGMKFPQSDLRVKKPHSSNDYFCSSVQFGEKLSEASSAHTYGEERRVGVGLPQCDIPFKPAHDMGGIVSFRNGSASCSFELQSEETEEGASDFEALTRDPLVYLLSYLEVKDLLSLERVSRSLYSVVHNDPMLWRTIHIDQPLNEKITDDVLLQLASRAQGELQWLNLVECPKVTNGGLMQILNTNLKLTKLYVPGCTRITISFIVHCIKSYNSHEDVRGGIKQLRIGGLYEVNHEHFEQLKLSMGLDKKMIESEHKPHIYNRDNCFLPYDDDRAIDVEKCPKCGEYRMIYDCPAEGCKGKDRSSQDCRACITCVERCAMCGRCIDDCEYEETFFLELLCLHCFKETFRPREDLSGPINCSGLDG